MAEVPSEEELSEAQRYYLDGLRGQLEHRTDSGAEGEEEPAPLQLAAKTVYVTLTRADVALLRAHAEAARIPCQVRPDGFRCGPPGRSRRPDRSPPSAPTPRAWSRRWKSINR